LIVFVALAYHPRPPRLILIEEPENGIHPRRLKDVVDLLREIAAGEHGGNSAQVIITTHSPYLLDMVNLEKEQVLVFRRNADGGRTAAPADEERLKIFLDEFKLGEVWFNRGEEGLIAKKQ
jgi:predicted ATPase